MKLHPRSAILALGAAAILALALIARAQQSGPSLKNVSLQWQAATNPVPVSYAVYDTTAGSNTVVGLTTNTSLVVSNVNVAYAHTYVVRSTDANGDYSPASNPATLLVGPQNLTVIGAQ